MRIQIFPDRNVCTRNLVNVIILPEFLQRDTALIPELAEVLRTVNPQKFDFVLFDACMMGCAEVYLSLIHIWSPIWEVANRDSLC